MSQRDIWYLILIFETNCLDHLKCNLALGALVSAVSSKMSLLFFIAHTLSCLISYLENCYQKLKTIVFNCPWWKGLISYQKKIFEDVHLYDKIYWVSPVSLWNSMGYVGAHQVYLFLKALKKKTFCCYFYKLLFITF